MYIIEAFVAQQNKCVSKRLLWVRFPIGGVKYLIFLFPHFANDGNPNSMENGERKYFNGDGKSTRFPSSLCLKKIQI